MALALEATRDKIETHLENFVSDFEGAILGRGAVWVEAAHKHRHASAVLVTGQTDAQTILTSLKRRDHEVARQRRVLLLHFV